MENFIVSARKYRPATFESVVGQLSITTTLKNAIKNNHLAHAYLFCGPRGVGKTTCARIFAKTINCFNITEQVEPCNQCESCKSFNESRSYNIHELDAASNNSVDDIRNLIDQVRIPPQIGKYSIYIIDEVHMLSASAFNAFLKTLEEPPKHAVFILATTEKHKIIPTILSRCQIFDFNRIQIDDTVQFLEKISKNEGNEYELDGLNIIAQKSDGAMRDALSIYDQIVSFSGGKITYKSVIENLNVLDYDYYFRLTDAFLKGNISESFLIFDEIINKGFDSHNFINGLSKHFRDILICKDVSTLQLLEVGNNIKEKYKQQSVECTPEFIFDCLNLCGQCDISFKSSRNQRLHIELVLVNLCQVQDKKKRTLELDNKETLEPKKHATPPIIKPSQTISQSQINSKAVPKEYATSISSTPSIKNLVNSSATTDIVNEAKELNSSEEFSSKKKTEDIRTENYSSDQLISVLKKYISTIETEKPRFFSALNSQEIKVTNQSIGLIFSNNTLLEDFNKNLRSELLNFIRGELKNDNIVIETTISEYEEKNLIYTTEEKYRHLLSKNPALGKLKQKLNLDLE